MIILTLKTDQPEAELTLFDDLKIIKNKQWLADRSLNTTLNLNIKELLEENGMDLKSISAIVFYKGPGSFTGLRIGASVVNSLAYILNVPIIGVSGHDWQIQGIKKILNNENQSMIIPEYGSPVNITTAKK